jgi:poly-gamma-glutamate synthesis protein (capsule biosynthesis protein)
MLARWIGRRIDRDGVDAPFRRFHSQFPMGANDLLIGNLECAITKRPTTAFKSIDLRADPKVADGLSYAGFSILSLANNHSGDCGPYGLADTQASLKDVGISTLTPDGTPVYRTVNGVKIAIIGLTDLPGYPLATNWEAEVKEARQHADDLVVIMHWGIEDTFPEDHRQRALAKRLAADGVDAIVGCHPHVLQPAIHLAGPKHRRCFVAYSLGNFVFDAKPGQERLSELVKLTVSKLGVQVDETVGLKLVDGFPQLRNELLSVISRPGSERMGVDGLDGSVRR